MAYQYVPYDGPVVTRAQAQAAGLKRYFTGKPCPAGHVCERWIASYSCDACQRLDSEKRYAENRHGRRSFSRERAKAAYHADLEASREKMRLIARLTYELRKPYMAAWREANRSRLNAKNRAKWLTITEAEREAKRVHIRNRRAKKRGNGGKHTAKQIKDLFAKQGGKCANCFTKLKAGYHADHIQPIARGGSNAIHNIQLLCQNCNQRKHYKDSIVWARENGRLI